MDDDGTDELVAPGLWMGRIERAVLSDSEEGRAISAAFIAAFGEFVAGTVRPILQDVAQRSGEPQLLVNGLAQMLREVADSIEFPVGGASSSRRTASSEDAVSDAADPS
jgi:hypothetical protein